VRSVWWFFLRGIRDYHHRNCTYSDCSETARRLCGPTLRDMLLGERGWLRICTAHHQSPQWEERGLFPLQLHPHHAKGIWNLSPLRCGFAIPSSAPPENRLVKSDGTLADNERIARAIEAMECLSVEVIPRKNLKETVLKLYESS
jgi:hypothetical protein